MPSSEHVPSYVEWQPDEDQLHRLEMGPGLVVHSVRDRLMSADEALNHDSMVPLRHLGNFSLYFSNPDSIAGIYRTLPHMQRFTILYPDLTLELEEYIQDPSFQVTNADIGADPRLIRAYELMRSLVDESDIRQKDYVLNVDPLYLLK